jgi:hypothetical protein
MFVLFSVPTPVLTEHITTTWPPLAPDNHRVLRINSKLSLQKDFIKDRIRYRRYTEKDIQDRLRYST